MDFSLGGFPECFVLLPQTEIEKSEIANALEAQGVCDGMGFVKNGINGRLGFPAILNWESDGSLALTVTSNQNQETPAWFWLVECEDGSGRRFAWWGTRRNRDYAIPWA
jgi:hypothetical protein